MFASFRPVPETRQFSLRSCRARQVAVNLVFCLPASERQEATSPRPLVLTAAPAGTQTNQTNYRGEKKMMDARALTEQCF